MRKTKAKTDGTKGKTDGPAQLAVGTGNIQVIGNDINVSISANQTNEADASFSPADRTIIGLTRSQLLVAIIGVVVAVIAIVVPIAVSVDPSPAPLTASPSLPSSLPVEDGRDYNVALKKPVSVRVYGDDPDPGAGGDPQAITDGRINYDEKAEDKRSNGVIGWVNHKDGHVITAEVTIDLRGLYKISEIRYTMGDVSRASSWNADEMITPFGSTETYNGSEYRRAWTRQVGSEILSTVHVQLLKTKKSWDTDWLFIGEIEVYGHRYPAKTK